MLKLGAVWNTASTMAVANATAQCRVIDDLSKIPVIPDHERILMRQAWRREHPELDLHEACEPHPRFVDRVRRDWALHGRVANYRLTELRVKTDVIDYKPAAMLNLEELVKTVREEVPAAKVDSEDQVFDRLMAFFVTLEFLQILSPDDFRRVGLRYLSELRRFRRLHPGLQYTVKADALFRQHVDLVTTDSPEIRFVTSLEDALDTKRFLWSSAVADVDLERHAAARKRPQEDHAAPAPAKTARRAQQPAVTPPRPPRKRQRSGPAANLPIDDTPASVGPGSPIKGHRDEMRRLADLASTPESRGMCRFYNTSQGCKKTSCTYVHKCIVCGAAHPAVRHHRL